MVTQILGVSLPGYNTIKSKGDKVYVHRSNVCSEFTIPDKGHRKRKVRNSEVDNFREIKLCRTFKMGPQ